MDGRRKARSYHGALLLLLVLVAASCDGVRRAAALSVTVNEKECVYEYVVYEGDTVSGNFVVVDHDIFWSSDHPGIDLEVTSPAGNVVHSLKGTSGDKFEFKAPRAGTYKFCFHNSYSTPETVSFYIHVGHIPNEHDLAKDEHLDPINVKIAELREALESVTAEQRYLKARDARHRHTNESTRRRLILYTLAEYLALACASGLQVASATATFVMLFSSSLSVVEFYFLKRFPIPYALYLTSVSLMAGFWGQLFVRKLVMVLRRASIIVFILSSVIFASAITMGVIGVEKSIHMISNHEYMGFLGFCTE